MTFHLRQMLKCAQIQNKRFISRLKPSKDNFQNINLNNNLKETADKIIYSSYLESKKLKFGYKKNRQIENAIKNKEKKLLLKASSDVKLLPLSLKYLDENSYPVERINSSFIEKSQKEFSSVKESIVNEVISKRKYPENWLEDHEYYNEDNAKSSCENGSANPSIKPSKVPCSGCGAHLHCMNVTLPGFIPSEIFIGRTEMELKAILCQRCHFLREFNVALDVTVSSEDYINILSSIRNKFALIVLIVDLLDFPGSIWPNIHNVLGENRPIFIVGNKVDLLPKDSPNYLNHIKNVLKTSVMDIGGIKEVNIKHTCLVSAETGYGVEELVTQLHSNWKYKGDVYLVGCTNVGKSSVFNALLNSDYCKVQAMDLVKKATISPWPGTTLNMLKFPILRPSDYRIYERCQRLIAERPEKSIKEHERKLKYKSTKNVKYATLTGDIGKTFKDLRDTLDPFSMATGANPFLALNERDKGLVNSKWCYDTPGVIQPNQVYDLLTTEELVEILPKEMILPRVFSIKPGMSVFIAGLARLDFKASDVNAIRIAIFAPKALPITITNIEDANEIYEQLLNTKIFSFPIINEDRTKKWPGLEINSELNIMGEFNEKATCDVVFSVAGWISLSIPKEKRCSFVVWSPENREIFQRFPALIPFGVHLRQKKVRNSLVYKKGHPIV